MYKFDSVKSARFFRGVGSYTPNSGVLGGVGWDPVLAKQWQSVLCQWSRMREMSEHRLNYKILCGLRETALLGIVRTGIIELGTC